ncbi:MAG: YcfA family protein [Phycisphaerales bacterium]|nr:YcfA family protein [Phycisphaerales bacterium]
MAKLPTDISGRELRAALERVGFVFRRQKGSHMVLRRDDPYARAVIPDHKQIRAGTLRSILVEAGLSTEQLLKLLGRS